MPGPGVKNIDWEPWDPKLRELNAIEPPLLLKAQYELLLKLDFPGAYSSFCNRRCRLGLWRRPPYTGHERLPPEETVRSRRVGPRRMVIGHKSDGDESRRCQRPAVGRPTSLTAVLMGDPPPGRTPWAA